MAISRTNPFTSRAWTNDRGSSICESGWRIEIRRFAVRLSAWVVRWSSPGCKDWAQGLSREIEYIEGDWAALVWSIGSTRILLDRRRSLPTVNRDAVAPLWWIFPMIAATQILSSVMDAWKAHSVHDRAAASLIAAGWVCWAALSIDDWFWQRDKPPVSDIQAFRLFVRATLERRLRHYRSERRWLSPLIAVSICAGFVMKFEANVIAAVVIAAGGALVLWMLFLDMPEEIRQRLTHINRLISEDANAVK